MLICMNGNYWSFFLRSLMQPHFVWGVHNNLSDLLKGMDDNQRVLDALKMS